MFDKVIKVLTQEKGFAFVASANITTALIGGIFWLFIASYISVEAFGQVNYFISLSTIIFGFGALGMDTTIMTFSAKKPQSFIYQSSSLVLVATSIISVVLGFFFNNFIIAVLAISLAFYYFSTTELITKMRYKELAIITIGAKTSQVGLSILLFVFFGLNGFLLGYAIAYFIFGYRFLSNLRHFTFKLGDLKETWRFSAKVFGSNTINTLTLYFDKILIASVFGYHMLGYYQFAFQIFLFVSIVPSILFRYLLPHEATGIVKRKIKFFGFGSAVLVAIIIALMAPVAIPIVFPKYVAAVQAIQIIGLAIIPSTLVSLIGTKILAEDKRMHHIFYAGLVMVTTEITIILTLGTLIGLNGIALSVIIAYTLQFLYLAIINKRKIF